MGGVYHGIDDLTWLRDRDSIIISDLDDVEKLPQLSMNAIHASLRPEIKLKPHQEEGIDKMIYMERAYRGGILADEMGLGKTLQMLAVVMKQQPKLAIRSATLVVVPSRSIADQWGDEIRSKTTFGSLPYLIYQQENAHLLEQALFRVVITTYAQIRTEWRKQQSTTNPSISLLYSIDWHRIILDEANHIRSLNSQIFDSVSDLRARFKWCVTGTPLQNEITELYPIFTFLEIPLDSKLRRNETYVKRILHSRMIRRTKELLSDHLMMMPKTENRIVLEFSEEEKALYDYLERLLYTQIKTWKATSDYGRSQRASALIYLRLKQVCGHFNIILKKFPEIIPHVRRGDEEAVVEGMYQEGVPEEGVEGYNADEGTELNEVYGLIDSYYDQFGNLLEPINTDALIKLPYRKHSTKVIWLTSFLKTLLNNNRTDKVVIVSQFIDLVDRISEVLTKATIKHYCYHGGLTTYHRKLALRNFNHDISSRVLVMSLKAGGVGLNLQTANHMIIMDRWWNPGNVYIRERKARKGN
ncbi:hypothetical protein K501DRAFT_172927 [Backusella circina FSU 941]|nr:hypothetical protein K501DRAFT_172927 [Backusella circina FSU 941]